MTKDEASGSKCDRTRARAMSNLANSAGELAGALRQRETARAELERRGIDPDMALHGLKLMKERDGAPPETITLQVVEEALRLASAAAHQSSTE